MSKFKEKYFTVRDEHRFCQHPTPTGVCGQRFAKKTSVSGLKKHFKLMHKITAQQLGQFAQPEEEIPIAVSPAAASQSDSVIDMVDEGLLF